MKPSIRSTRRALAVAAVALCCTLSGCSGSATDTRSRSTPPDATTPDTSNRTTAPPSGGVSEITIGIDDPSTGPLTFDALAAGDPERIADGRLVLLLHGFPETDESFRALLGPLAEQGWYAVAPNQRGYSPGAQPDRVQDYDLGSLSADVLAMADTLGADRFHVVGHDWGGAVAWATAKAGGERILSLTSLSTPHPDALSDAYVDPDSGQANMSSYMSVFRSAGSESVFLGPTPEDPVAAADAYVSTITDAGLPEAAARRYAPALANPTTMRLALNWYRANPIPTDIRLGSIDTPTLYLWGEEDAALGKVAAEATRSHVTGPYTFVAIPKAGHWLPESNAAEVLEPLLTHLADNAGGDPG